MEQNDLGMVIYDSRTHTANGETSNVGGSMLTARQRKIIRSMLPNRVLVGDVIPTVRVHDSFGTLSVLVPSTKYFANQFVTREDGTMYSIRVPLKRRVYMDRLGAFNFGKFGDREYFARF